MGEVYDDVAYPGYPYPQTHPDRLGLIGRTFGLDPAPAHRCRVLELGCGDGMNVVGMAAAVPGLEAVGIDRVPGPLARGREVAAELGLANVRLEVVDLLEAGDLGEFDYVVAHGVYSWTPEAVRDAALALAGRALAAHGLAFFSFVAHPGGHLRTMVREIGLLAGGPERAEAFFGELLDVFGERPDPYARAVDFELRRMRSRPHSTLVHDDLSAAYGPVWLLDFVEHAGRRGLRRLAEAEPAELRPGWVPAEVAERLDALAGEDRLAREQLADVIGGRAYRESVLCRADAPAGEPDLAALDEPLPVRWATAAGDRPEAFPLARLQAARGEDVTNLRHEHLRLADPAAREMLTLMDGTRPRSAFPDRALEQVAEMALLIT